MTLSMLDMDSQGLEPKRPVQKHSLSKSILGKLFFYISQLQKDGYKLKNQYKNEENHIAFVVKPGETMSVVFKKIKGDGSVTWPPKGVQIYEKTDASKILKK